METRFPSLTRHELSIMETLWAFPCLDYHEIIQRAAEQGECIPEGSVHRALRRLLDYDFIVISGEKSAASTRIKKFSPAITIDEYICAVLDENPILEEKHLPGVIVFLYRKIRSRETRAELLAIIQNEKERLQ